MRVACVVAAQAKEMLAAEMVVSGLEVPKKMAAKQRHR